MNSKLLESTAGGTHDVAGQKQNTVLSQKFIYFTMQICIETSQKIIKNVIQIGHCNYYKPPGMLGGIKKRNLLTCREVKTHSKYHG